MKKIILGLSLCASLVACEAPEKDGDVAKPGSNTSEKAGAGPYTVTFSGADQSYEHSFNIPIRQEEGKVEYYIETPQSVQVEFLETKLKVSGCIPGSVKHEVFWVPNVAVSAGSYLAEGMSFRTQGGVRGSFQHQIRGLGGCTDISLSTKLKVKPRAARSCLESKNPGQCQVLAYCRSDRNAFFTEAEVWKEANVVTIYKFSNLGDGTRVVMAMAEGRSVQTGRISDFSSHNGDMYLWTDSLTGEGRLRVSAGGVTTEEKLICPY